MKIGAEGERYKLALYRTEDRDHETDRQTVNDRHTEIEGKWDSRRER